MLRGHNSKVWITPVWEAGQHRYGAGRGGTEGEGAVSRGGGRCYECAFMGQIAQYAWTLGASDPASHPLLLS